MFPLKNKFIVSILFLVTGCSNAQEDSLLVLQNSWTNLKVQLQRRNEITSSLITGFNKAGLMDSLAFKEIRTELANFTRFSENDRDLDSTIVKLTNQKAEESKQLLSKTFNLLITDKRFNKDDFRNFQMELESTENRINVARKNFNDLCIKYKRNDLLFDPKIKPSIAIQLQ